MTIALEFLMLGEMSNRTSNGGFDLLMAVAAATTTTTPDLVFDRFSLVAEIFFFTSSELYFDFPKGNPGPTTQG